MPTVRIVKLHHNEAVLTSNLLLDIAGRRSEIEKAMEAIENMLNAHKSVSLVLGSEALSSEANAAICQEIVDNRGPGKKRLLLAEELASVTSAFTSTHRMKSGEVVLGGDRFSCDEDLMTEFGCRGSCCETELLYAEPFEARGCATVSIPDKVSVFCRIST